MNNYVLDAADFRPLNVDEITTVSYLQVWKGYTTRNALLCYIYTAQIIINIIVAFTILGFSWTYNGTALFKGVRAAFAAWDMLFAVCRLWNQIDDGWWIAHKHSMIGRVPNGEWAKTEFRRDYIRTGRCYEFDPVKP